MAKYKRMTKARAKPKKTKKDNYGQGGPLGYKNRYRQTGKA